MEQAKYGEIEEMIVADNIGDHMIGNVYTKFVTEDQAAAAMAALNGRYYAGKVIVAEYSPLTDFREAKCRQYTEGQCDSKQFFSDNWLNRRRILQLHAPKAREQRIEEPAFQVDV